jgi:hypothetical protein
MKKWYWGKKNGFPSFLELAPGNSCPGIRAQEFVRGRVLLRNC